MHILVFMHVVVSGSATTITAKAIANTLANSNKTIECIVSGHTHRDVVGLVGTVGVPFIVTTCDAFVGQWTHEEGTVDEQAFDLMTFDYTDKIAICRRVGRGKTRFVHYNPHTLQVNGTLDISNLITITPTEYSAEDNLSYVSPTTEKAAVDSNGIVSGISAGVSIVKASNDEIDEIFIVNITE